MQSQTSFTTSPKRGRGNRGSSPPNKQDKSNDLNSSYESRIHSHDDQKLTSKLDMSYLHKQENDQNQNENEKEQQKKADTISQKQEDDEQLEPDKSKDHKLLDESGAWDDDNKDIKEEKKEVDKIPQRGNRGKQSTQKELYVTPKNSSGNQSNSNRNVNPDHQLPQESTVRKQRGNRYENESKEERPYINRPYPQRQRQQGSDYNRGRGGGRGSYNPNYRGGDRDYNRQGSDSYRGGRDYNSGYRGPNRGDRRGGYNNNYGRRNYGTEQDDQNSQNNEKKYQTDKELNQSTYKPDFQKKQRPYHQNNYNNNYNQDNSYRRQEPRVIQKIVEKTVQIEKEKIVEKLILPPRPTGIRVQPSVSIFVKGCKLVLTCRRLEQFQADLLVIPYKTPKLELYPGSFVNSLEINYKDKLKEKAPQLQEKGKLVYMQKCLGSDRFKALAFIKVTDPQNNIKKGISQLLQNIKLIQSSKKDNASMQKFESIVFPISSQLGASKTVLSSFIKEVQKYSSIVKDVYVSTEDPKVFCQAVTKFNEIFVQLFDQNEISFN